MSTILNLFYDNLKKDKYNSYIFMDGVPSYNKILNQKKNKIFENIVSIVDKPLKEFNDSNYSKTDYNASNVHPNIENIKKDGIINTYNNTLVEYLQKNDFINNNNYMNIFTKEI